MAILFRGRHRPTRLKPKSTPKRLQEVLKLFLDNPEKEFGSDEEIVSALQRRETTLTKEEIVYRRKWLFEKKYIKHHVKGGPHRKRYILNPNRPAKLPEDTVPSEPRTTRMASMPCVKPTLDQWRELQQAVPLTISHLAAALHDESDASFALHDALLEYGLVALADHFMEGSIHTTDGASGCWALRCLTGQRAPAEQKILTADAAKWLGLSQDQFIRVARGLQIKPDRSEFPARGPIRRALLWLAADVAAMYDAPKVVALRALRDA